MRLDDPDDEMAAAVAEAAKCGPRSCDRYRRFLEIVLDAEQAQRPWAVEELAAIQWAGVGARFKRHWKPEPKAIAIGKISIDVQTVVGVVRDGHHHQLPLVEITPDELRTLVRHRTLLRDRSTGELALLRRLVRFVDEHAEATTIGDALTAGSVDLLAVMAGAA